MAKRAKHPTAAFVREPGTRKVTLRSRKGMKVRVGRQRRTKRGR